VAKAKAKRTRSYEQERARQNARADALGYSHRWAQGHPLDNEIPKRTINQLQSVGRGHNWHTLYITRAQWSHLPKQIRDLICPPGEGTPDRAPTKDDPKVVDRACIIALPLPSEDYPFLLAWYGR
jgi:hypothetical protein